VGRDRAGDRHTSTAEILVELAEYFFKNTHHATAYFDTLADMASTVVGAVIGSLIGAYLPNSLGRRIGTTPQLANTFAARGFSSSFPPAQCVTMRRCWSQSWTPQTSPSDVREQTKSEKGRSGYHMPRSRLTNGRRTSGHGRETVSGYVSISAPGLPSGRCHSNTPLARLGFADPGGATGSGFSVLSTVSTGSTAA
jgi:hypothetical protein